MLPAWRWPSREAHLLQSLLRRRTTTGSASPRESCAVGARELPRASSRRPSCLSPRRSLPRYASPADGTPRAPTSSCPKSRADRAPGRRSAESAPDGEKEKWPSGVDERSEDAASRGGGGVCRPRAVRRSGLRYDARGLAESSSPPLEAARADLLSSVQGRAERPATSMSLSSRGSATEVRNSWRC